MISSIIFLIPYLLGYKNNVTYLTFFIFFLTLDPTLLGEVFLWSSGFYNYIPPVFISLVIILFIKFYPSLKCFFSKALCCFSIFVLGISSQLYVEHSTIVNLVLSISFIVFAITKKTYTLMPPLILWLFSTIIGTIIMFSIPILFFVEGNRSEGYRSYNIQSILTLIVSCAKNLLRLGNYYSGINALPICAGSIVTIYATRNVRSSTKNNILAGLSLLCSGLLLFANATSINLWGGELAIIHHIFYFGVVFSQLLLWVLVCIKIPCAHSRNRVFFLLFMAFISLSPLLLVSPVPTRTVFQSYIFFCAATLVCLSHVTSQGNIKHSKRILPICMVTCFSLIIAMSITFIGVKMMVDTREKYILQELQNNSEEIVIYKIPYKYTSWDSVWSFNHHFFREKKEDTTFYAVDYTLWMNDYFPSLNSPIMH